MLNFRPGLPYGLVSKTAAALVAAAVFVWAAGGGLAAGQAPTNAGGERAGQSGRLKEGEHEAAPVLAKPIACEIGRTCFMQSHVDLVAGEGIGDFACGLATYEGHKGTDFRVLSNAATMGDGVPVLAAAAGRVRGMRDGMADVLLRDAGKTGERLARSLKDRECGNGVVVDHGGGWETQYCHLRRGSVAVRNGETVSAGQRLGSVGYSGKADFAHLHFEVRKDGRTVDPFLGEIVAGLQSEGAQCDPRMRGGGTRSKTSMWADEAAQQMVYRTGVILDAGFSGRTLGSSEYERDHRIAPPTADSPALVFAVRAMNLQKGDRIRMKVTGPGGFEVGSDGKPVDRPKAIWVAYAGKRLKAERWASGTYSGVGEVVRDGEVVSSRRVEFDLR